MHLKLEYREMHKELRVVLSTCYLHKQIEKHGRRFPYPRTERLLKCHKTSEDS